MKYNVHFKEIIKKISKRSKSLQDTQLMHPQREWAIGLGVGFIFFVSAAFLGAYTYFKNQSVDIQSGDTSTEEVVYRESLVTEVLESINTRAKNLDALSGQANEAPASLPVPVATSSDPVELETVETESVTPELSFE